MRLTSLPVDILEIEAASERIAEYVLKTPVVTSADLNKLTGAKLFLKCESLQHVGAFKSRGACNAVFTMNEDAAQLGVVTHSSGNHAAALARAARLRGIPVHIVMPGNAPKNKIEAVRSWSVEPVLCGPTSADRVAAAEAVIEETGAVLIHPFDDERIIAGQGTTALELLSQVDTLDDVIIPVGGGGLLSGMAIAIKSIAPHVNVYGAEPAMADDAKRSMIAGRREPALRYDTIADGLRTELGERPFEIVHSLVDDILLCPEEEIIAATWHMLRKGRIVAEPSGAVGLAVMLANEDLFRDRRVGVVVTGGNLNPEFLTSTMQPE